MALRLRLTVRMASQSVKRFLMHLWRHAISSERPARRMHLIRAAVSVRRREYSYPRRPMSERVDFESCAPSPYHPLRILLGYQKLR